jgi:hypothetical protein
MWLLLLEQYVTELRMYIRRTVTYCSSNNNHIKSNSRNGNYSNHRTSYHAALQLELLKACEENSLQPMTIMCQNALPMPNFPRPPRLLVQQQQQQQMQQQHVPTTGHKSRHLVVPRSHPDQQGSLIRRRPPSPHDGYYNDDNHDGNAMIPAVKKAKLQGSIKHTLHTTATATTPAAPHMVSSAAHEQQRLIGDGVSWPQVDGANGGELTTTVKRQQQQQQRLQQLLLLQ